MHLTGPQSPLQGWHRGHRCPPLTPPEGKAVGLPPQQWGTRRRCTHGRTEPPPTAPRLSGQQRI